jgi:sulfatase modifying factor 1
MPVTIRRASLVPAALLALAPLSAAAKPASPLPPLHAPEAAAAPAESGASTTGSDKPAVALDWVRIRAGQFDLGSDFNGAVDIPGRLVHVPAFEIGRTEVTVAQYQACVDAGACEARETVSWKGITPEDARFWSAACNADAPGNGDHPMNCVNAKDAEAFCNYAGARLPSAQEWEFAARGTEDRTFPWGDDAPDARRVNTCGEGCFELGTANGKSGFKAMRDAENHFTTTSPVGSFPAGRTPEGVADMAGNVWEWLAAPVCHAPSGDRSCTDTRRQHRGGGWWTNDPQRLSAAFVMKHAPEHRSANLGFRCAR